ncbi:MAG: NAD+ synthase [Desulfobacterales bacterium]|nr:NAD+ synthase [Desulfobacterales bacterium]
MKIALAQINPVIGDYETNGQKVIDFAARARAAGCDLVVFPELALCGYPPRDLLEKRDFIDAGLNWLNRFVAEIRGIGVICGFVDRNPSDLGKPLLNGAVLFEDGTVLHRTHKRLLPTYDVFDEQRYFEPGADISVVSYKGRRLGLTICEDAWNDKEIFRRRLYGIDPVATMAGAGADLIVNISASPFHGGKREFRWHMHSAAARKHGVTFVYVNQVGGNDSLLFDGLSAVFDTEGEIRARAAEFEEDLVCYDTDSRSGDMREICGSENESILRALVTGTRDYVRKCGFSKVVIGLSGGIDSALTAWIAAEALGPHNVSTVFMPSPYTSADNFTDTRQLAENLGAGYDIIPIGAIFDAFVTPLCPDFDASAPGVTEQNIQARIRGTILMALSNRDGSLVLSTGNKSELALGYCTLYGDMNGGLAVISDVPKTMVYTLSRFINRDREVIPRRIVEKPPSAELAPDQQDQDDLPPYEEIDPILRGYVENLQGRADLEAAGFDPATVGEVVSRIERNEYKRRQAAPGLKVTVKAFGEGRRYPLARRLTGAG